MSLSSPSTPASPRSSARAAALGPLRGQRLLVTGSSGFIGGHLVDCALAAGAKVTALTRAGSEPGRLHRHAGLEIVQVDDLRDAAALADRVAHVAPDIVLHLAALADWRQDPSLTCKMVDAHVVGTANLLEAARAAAVTRVVLFGSAGEYGDHGQPLGEERREKPLDPYSATKLAATNLGLMYHRSFGLPCTVVRPFVVYGPGESAHRLIPSIFATAAAGGGPVDFTAGTQRRDFVYVDDVAEGALRAALVPAAAGEVLNLGTGIATSVRDMASRAIEVSGNRVVPHFGARPMRVGEPLCLVADMAKTERILGWRPRVSLREGLQDFWERAAPKGEAGL